MSSMRPFKYFVVTCYCQYMIDERGMQDLQLRFVDQSSRHSGSRFQQRAQLILQCPCMRLRLEELVVSTRERAFHRGKANTVS